MFAHENDNSPFQVVDNEMSSFDWDWEPYVRCLYFPPWPDDEVESIPRTNSRLDEYKEEEGIPTAWEMSDESEMCTPVLPEVEDTTKWLNVLVERLEDGTLPSSTPSYLDEEKTPAESSTVDKDYDSDSDQGPGALEGTYQGSVDFDLCETTENPNQPLDLGTQITTQVDTTCITVVPYIKERSLTTENRNQSLDLVTEITTQVDSTCITVVPYIKEESVSYIKEESPQFTLQEMKINPRRMKETQLRWYQSSLSTPKKPHVLR